MGGHFFYGKEKIVKSVEDSLKKFICIYFMLEERDKYEI